MTQQSPYEDLITGMRNAQAELTPLDEEIARLESERREVLARAVSELGDRALGQTITVTNITDLRNWQVLQPFNAHNSMQSSAFTPSDLRTYEGALHNYSPAVPLRNPRSVTGEIVGIDVPRSSLIIKPRVLRRIGAASRYWAVLTNEYGESLVKLEGLEEES